MKMMRTILAVALVLSLAACSDESGRGTNEGRHDVEAVKVAVSYPQSTALRSVADPVADQEPMKLVTADIFFTDGDGVILKHVGVGNDNGSVQFSVKNVEDGNAVVRGMTNLMVKCYIVANFEPATAPIDGDMAVGGANISTVLAKTMTVDDINVTDGSVTKLPLLGEGSVTFVNPDKSPVNGTSPDGQQYGGVVNVTLNSLATRLQIGKITAEDFILTEDDDDNPGTPEIVVRTVSVKEFEVEGIYINHFYPAEPIGTAGPASASLVDNGQDEANYLATGATYSTPGLGDMMHDNPAYAVATDDAGTLTLLAGAELAGPPATPKVWAYNLMPGVPPHVIIRFSKLVITDSSNSNPTEEIDMSEDGSKPLFISAKGFLDSNNERVNAFAVNNVYTLDNIAFNWSDLAEVPEDESLNVQVNVTMMKWKDNPITWEKN